MSKTNISNGQLTIIVEAIEVNESSRELNRSACREFTALRQQHPAIAGRSHLALVKIDTLIRRAWIVLASDHCQALTFALESLELEFGATGEAAVAGLYRPVSGPAGSEVHTMHFSFWIGAGSGDRRGDA